MGVILTLIWLPAATANDFSVVGDAAKGVNRVLVLEFALQEPGQYILFALGPSQTDLSNPIADPKLSLLTNGNQLVDSVDNWSEHPSSRAVIEAFDEFGVFLQATEAAMVVRLQPGPYRVLVENGVPVWGKTRTGITRWDRKTDGNVGGNVPAPKVKPGLWQGTGDGNLSSCLFVSGDGSRLTSTGSNCGNGSAISISSACGSLILHPVLDPDVPISDEGIIEVATTANYPWAPTITKVTGKLDGGKASGTLTKTLTFLSSPQVSSCEWTASPVQ